MHACIYTYILKCIHTHTNTHLRLPSTSVVVAKGTHLCTTPCKRDTYMWSIYYFKPVISVYTYIHTYIDACNLFVQL
jgi:hypothetical protein